MGWSSSRGAPRPGLGATALSARQGFTLRRRSSASIPGSPITAIDTVPRGENSAGAATFTWNQIEMAGRNTTTTAAHTPTNSTTYTTPDTNRRSLPPNALHLPPPSVHACTDEAGPVCKQANTRRSSGELANLSLFSDD